MIPLRDIIWIPLLLMCIYSMSPTIDLPTPMTITTTMALIAMGLVATTSPKALAFYIFGLLQHYLAKWPGLPSSSIWQLISLDHD